VYRAGDQIAAWSYTGFLALGLGMAAISFVAAPLAGLWLVIAFWLGRRHALLAHAGGPPVPAQAVGEAAR
jgi:AAA family ATP:ADP antiporter